jgi:hypothetical protein
MNNRSIMLEHSVLKTTFRQRRIKQYEDGTNYIIRNFIIWILYQALLG